VLDGLFVTPAVTAITESLAVLGDRGREIAVVGNAKLATALAGNRTVTPVGITGRAAAKLANAIANTHGLPARSLDAVIAVDIVDDDGWRETLREWTRVTRDGGAVVLVDRGHAAEASRRALCAGLSELEQRHAGKTVITSGLVTHLPDD
jgi:hypothetical protein